MAFKSRRSMTLDNTPVAVGDIVPDSVIESLRSANPGRFQSMVRLGLLLEVADEPATKTVEETPKEVSSATDDEETDEEGLCPTCGKGPFKRLQAHMTKAHP